MASWIIAIFLAAFLAELGAIEFLNRGHLTYTLDDSYIHLAMAEEIAHGHYGINSSEFSAPSSSILWPFLIAPFAWVSLDLYAPLLLSFFASIGTLLIFLRVLSNALAHASLERRQTFVFLAGLSIIPATNLLGLAFTGLEHCLQVFAAVWLTYGLIESERTGLIPRWLPFAVVLGPLIRYENLSVSLPAVAYLLWRRRYLASVLSGAGLIAVLLSFSIFLRSLGLDVLPSSVLTKSDPFASGGQLMGFVENLRVNIGYRQGSLLGVALIPLLAITFGAHRERQDRVLAAWLACSIATHLILGAFGEFFRYELYLWSAALLTGIHLSRGMLVRFVQHSSATVFALSLAGFVMFACTPYLYATLVTPFGANNIYEQQYQMHVFAKDYYHGPVAVNDIGLVSYRNDAYTLDLFGLATPESLRMRRADPTGRWLALETQKHHVHLVMIYDSWFPKHPETWIPLGHLELGGHKITPDERTVSFYATDALTAGAVAPMLRRFAARLPHGARFELEI